jgi:hypothetical protein
MGVVVKRNDQVMISQNGLHSPIVDSRLCGLEQNSNIIEDSKKHRRER